MPTRTLPGAWSTPHLSGGCPQHATWRSNPQYTLEPLATASYELSLRQPPARNMLAIGLVVLHGTAPSVAAEAGPLQAAALVGKSAWKASPVQTLTVQLEAGQSYRVVRRHGQSFPTRSRTTRPPTRRPADRPTGRSLHRPPLHLPAQAKPLAPRGGHAPLGHPERIRDGALARPSRGRVAVYPLTRGRQPGMGRRHSGGLGPGACPLASPWRLHYGLWPLPPQLTLTLSLSLSLPLPLPLALPLPLPLPLTLIRCRAPGHRAARAALRWR